MSTEGSALTASSLDFTGFNLAQKKSFKENTPKLQAAVSAIAKLAAPSFQYSVDIPSFAKFTKDEYKDCIGDYAFTRPAEAFQYALERIAKDSSIAASTLKTELKGIHCKCIERVGDARRITYYWKDGVFTWETVGDSLSSDPILDNLERWLPGQIFVPETKEEDGLNVSGLTLECAIRTFEKKKEHLEQKARIKALGFDLKIDLQSLRKSCDFKKSEDNDSFAGELLVERWTYELAQFLTDFCSDADYKEALNGAITTIVLTTQKNGEDNPRFIGDGWTVEGKQLTITANAQRLTSCDYSNYSALKPFLEKML